MYEIKIKGKPEPILVENIIGERTKKIFMDDQTYPDNQKMSILNWAGTKGEIKSVFEIYDHKGSIDTVHSDQDLKAFEKELEQYFEDRVQPDGSTFKYLTQAKEREFLQDMGVIHRDNNPSNETGYAVTNPKGYFGLREKLSQLFSLHGRREYAIKKGLEQLVGIEHIGEMPVDAEEAL